MTEDRAALYQRIKELYTKLIRQGYDRSLVKREICRHFALTRTSLYYHIVDLVEIDTHIGEEFSLIKHMAEIEQRQ